MIITRRATLTGLAGAALAPRSVLAQRRIVRLIVPAAPGGAIDVIGRLYAQRIAPALDESWVVENKAGASNTLGAAEVARATPDGTTYLTNADIHIMAKHVMRSVSYDPLTDFTPISRFATSPMVRSWVVRVAASWFTLSVRSRQVPAAPGTFACPPSFPSTPTSRATVVT